MSDDDDSEIRVELGPAALIDQLLAVGQLRRARDIAIDLVSSAPGDPSSFIALASVLLAAREHAPAVEASRQAIELAPDWAHAWSVHSAALFNTGRFREAEAAITEAIRLEPEETRFFSRYARILRACGFSERALELSRRALELDPADEEAHSLFADLLHEVHPSKWRLSEEIARRAIGLNPEDADSYAVLGSILLTARRYDEAEGAFRTALELEPFNALAFGGLAEVVMARNLLYRPFLWYGLLMGRLGVGAQLLVVASLYALASALRVTVFRQEPAASILNASYLALCAYTWFATPLTRALLRRKYPWL
jgi:cytochrome c-type biogenesis protein CcmH/NrfG